MPENKKKINFAFRVSEDRQQELKFAAIKRKQSVQGMLEAGLELLLADDAPQIPAQPKYRASNLALHDKLERILNSGDTATIKAVVPNIEIFFDRLKPSRSGRAHIEDTGLIARPEEVGPEVIVPRKRASGKS